MPQGLAVDQWFVPPGFFYPVQVPRTCGVYNMMSKLKSCLIGLSSSLVLAFALLAFSFAFGAVRSHAETFSCSPPAMDIVAELAEELDVLCQSQAASALDAAEVESPQPIA